MSYQKNGDSLKVDFMLNDDDIVSFQKFLASQSKIAVRTKWIAILVVAAVLIFLFARDIPLAKLQPNAGAIVPWIVIFIVIWIAVFFQMRSVRGKPVRGGKTGAANERRFTLEIRPELILVEDDTTKAQHNWLGIPRIDSNDGYVFIFLTDFSAYAIPRRAFPNDSGFHEFRDAATHYVERARTKATPPTSMTHS